MLLHTSSTQLFIFKLYVHNIFGVTNKEGYYPAYQCTKWLIVKHQEDQRDTSPVTGLQASKYGNAYHHPQLGCIRWKMASICTQWSCDSTWYYGVSAVFTQAVALSKLGYYYYNLNLVLYTYNVMLLSLLLSFLCTWFVIFPLGLGELCLKLPVLCYANIMFPVSRWIYTVCKNLTKLT